MPRIIQQSWTIINGCGRPQLTSYLPLYNLRSLERLLNSLSNTQSWTIMNLVAVGQKTTISSLNEFGQASQMRKKEVIYANATSSSVLDKVGKARSKEDNKVRKASLVRICLACCSQGVKWGMFSLLLSKSEVRHLKHRVRVGEPEPAEQRGQNKT